MSSWGVDHDFLSTRGIISHDMVGPECALCPVFQTQKQIPKLGTELKTNVLSTNSYTSQLDYHPVGTFELQSYLYDGNLTKVWAVWGTELVHLFLFPHRFTAPGFSTYLIFGLPIFFLCGYYHYTPVHQVFFFTHSVFQSLVFFFCGVFHFHVDSLTVFSLTCLLVFQYFGCGGG